MYCGGSHKKSHVQHTERLALDVDGKTTSSSLQITECPTTNKADHVHELNDDENINATEEFIAALAHHANYSPLSLYNYSAEEDEQQ